MRARQTGNGLKLTIRRPSQRLLGVSQSEDVETFRKKKMLFFSSMERGDDTWRGIPNRLVNETYVSRHISMYMFFVARTHK